MLVLSTFGPLVSDYSQAVEVKNNILIINEYHSDLEISELHSVFKFSHIVLPELNISKGLNLGIDNDDLKLLTEISNLNNEPKVLLSLGRFHQVPELFLNELSNDHKIDNISLKLSDLCSKIEVSGVAFLFGGTFEDFSFDEKLVLSEIVSNLRINLINEGYLVSGYKINHLSLFDPKKSNLWQIGEIDKHADVITEKISRVSKNNKENNDKLSRLPINDQKKNPSKPKTNKTVIDGSSGSSSGGGSIIINHINNQTVDKDHDGILDSQDNCLSVANHDQFDHDSDGIGNVCDSDYQTYISSLNTSNRSSNQNFGYGYGNNDNQPDPNNNVTNKTLQTNSYCFVDEENVFPFTGQNNCLLKYDETVIEEGLNNANYGIANSPLASFNGNVYLLYVREDPNNNEKYQTIVARSQANGIWSYSVVDDNTRYDPYHNHPSLAVDSLGFVHIAYNMHNTPWQYKVSKNPEDISEWEFKGQYAGEQTGGTTANNSDCTDDCADNWYSTGTASIPGNQITYPYFIADNNGVLYLTFRECIVCSEPIDNHRHRGSGLVKYDVNNKSWSRVGNTHFIADQSYLGQILRLSFDKNNHMYLSWVFGPHYSPSSNTYYAESKYLGHAISTDNGNSFHTVNGTSYSLPIDYSQYSQILDPEWSLSAGEYMSGYSEIGALNGFPHISLRPRNINRAWINYDGNNWTTPSALNNNNAYHFLINYNDKIYSVSSNRLHRSMDGGNNWEEFNLWTSYDEKADKTWLDYVYSRNQEDTLRFLIQDNSGKLKLYKARYDDTAKQTQNNTTNLQLPIVFGFSQPTDVINPGENVKDQIKAQVAQGVYEVPIYPGGSVSPDGSSLALLGSNPPDLSNFMNLLTEIENEDPNLNPNDLRLRVYIRASVTTADAGPPANPNSPGKFELSDLNKRTNLIDLINKLANGEIYNIDGSRIDEFTLDFEDTTASNFDPADIDTGDNIDDSSISTVAIFISELKQSGFSKKVGLYSLGVLNENWFPNELETPGSPFASSPRNWISQVDLQNLFTAGLDVFEFAAYSIFPDLNGSGGFADPTTYGPIHDGFSSFVNHHIQTIQDLGKDPQQNLRILLPVYTDPNVIDLSTALSTLQNLVTNQIFDKIYGGVFDFGSLDANERSMILNAM